MNQRVKVAWLGVLAAGSASALAADSKEPAGAGVVTSVVETIVTRRADGAVVTTTRPVKDIAAFFESMGAPIPPIAPQE